jgi:hypothetical protein
VLRSKGVAMSGRPMIEGADFRRRAAVAAETLASMIMRFLTRVIASEHACTMPGGESGDWSEIDSLEVQCAGGDYACPECGIAWNRLRP